MAPAPALDLKATLTSNRLLGLWRMMAGFRLTYLAASPSLGIAAISKTGTYLVIRYYVDHVLGMPGRSATLPLIAGVIVALALFEGGFTFLSGRLEATDEEVDQAAEVAGSQAFIERLDMGYDTDVGEGGGLLSVGQKQLISLARAALAHPEIFIMDEATSSVDTLTEAMIQRGMGRLMEGRTSFIIAHRLSTIKRADRILVIDSGRVVEMGSHAELLRQRGRYYNLYTRQFRRQLERDYNLASLVGASA